MNEKAKPLVTFMMLAYNTEKYVAQAIESVLNQTEPNFEFFIRNNGSTDKTGEICRKYAEKDSRIVLFENEKNWVYGTTAWPQKMRGEYVAQVDSDDLLDKDFLKILYAKAKEYDADLVIGAASSFNDGDLKVVRYKECVDCIVDENHILDSKQFEKLYPMLRTQWGKLYRNNYSKLVNGEFFFDIPKEFNEGGYNGRDTYMTLSYFNKAKVIIGVSAYLYNYRIRQASTFYSAVVQSKRIIEGDYIFLKGLEVLQCKKIDDSKAINYLFSVHYGHILELMQMVNSSKSMTMDEKISFYNDVIQDNIFNNYYKFLSKEMKEEFEKGLLQCLSEKQIIWRDEHIYLLMFYYFLEDKASKLAYIRLFAAICSKENTYQFGKQYITELNIDEKVKRVFEELIQDNEKPLTDMELIQQRFNQTYTEHFAIEKETVIEFLDKQKYSEAYAIILDILGKNPFDREMLYFHIYVEYCMGHNISALVTAKFVECFFKTDEEMMKLVIKVKGK